MGIRHGLARVAALAAALLASILFVYAGATVVLGLLSVNRDAIAPADGIEIFLLSNGAHAAFALPLVSPAADLRRALPLPDVDHAADDGYLMIGWGDARVYPSTQSWSQLTVSNALTALLGLNSTVMHVEHIRRPRPSERGVAVRVGADGYRRLLSHIAGSLRGDTDGRLVRVPGASHGRRDAFYEALGRYTLIYTCNEWVREGLAKAGVRTARWAPLEQALFWHLRR